MNVRNSWSGTKFHCPLCAFILIEDSEDEKEEEEFDWLSNEDYDTWLENHPYLYNDDDDSASYHCSSEQCFYHSNSLKLFHPLRGFKSKAGDSWALGFPSHWWNGKIHCAFCGHYLINDSNNDYHCSNSNCFYKLKYSLTLLQTQNNNSWAIGYIK